MKNKTGSLVSKEYSLDRLGAKPVLRLPTAKSPAGSSDNLAQGAVPAELQEKVASLLASESSRKVSASFAMVPTITALMEVPSAWTCSVNWKFHSVPVKRAGPTLVRHTESLRDSHVSRSTPCHQRLHA